MIKSLHLVIVAIIETLAQTTEKILFQIYGQNKDVFDLHIHIMHLGSKHTPQYYVLQKGVKVCIVYM